MTEIPEPRADGICCECNDKPAETLDGRFCKRCLRARIRDANPIASTFSDQRGRDARSSKVLGGSPDVRSTDDLD